MPRRRILVIDDDPLIRSLMASLLRKEYLVSLASEGSEGYYKALEHVPDLVLIDVQMPGWDGLRTLRAFRSHPSLSSCIAVMLTVDASKGTVLAAIDMGASDYIIKSALKREEFLWKIRRHLPPAEQEPFTLPESVLNRSVEANAPADSARTSAEPSQPSEESLPESPELSAEEQEQARMQVLLDAWE
jgi:CheY-like chemotaxis protein